MTSTNREMVCNAIRKITIAYLKKCGYAREPLLRQAGIRELHQAIIREFGCTCSSEDLLSWEKEVTNEQLDDVLSLVYNYQFSDEIDRLARALHAQKVAKVDKKKEK